MKMQYDHTLSDRWCPIRDALTLIIHTKWSVDWSAALISFLFTKLYSKFMFRFKRKKELFAMKKGYTCRNAFFVYVWHNLLICTEKIILARNPAWRVLHAIISSTLTMTCAWCVCVCSQFTSTTNAKPNHKIRRSKVRAVHIYLRLWCVNSPVVTLNNKKKTTPRLCFWFFVHTSTSATDCSTRMKTKQNSTCWRNEALKNQNWITSPGRLLIFSLSTKR